jgi:drug/metabolite transporter (DMT)-like permease
VVVVLALASSLCYGLADFVGGLLARRTGAWSVAVVGNTSATFCTAVVAFLVATQSGFLTVAAVLSSLYPASTVLLAALVLHEHIDRGQGLGLLLAAVSVGLVAVG